MNEIKASSALICVDFINELVTEGGKLTSKGYLEYVRQHETLSRASKLQSLFRSKQRPILHVRLAFSNDYAEHPSQSPLFGKAKEFRAFEQGAWGSDFASMVKPYDAEKVLLKRRVSAFYGTDLEVTLRSMDIKSVYIVGVATDLAVESTARDAHDRDFNVVVVEDCCGAASTTDHDSSLTAIAKIASLVRVNEE